MKKSTAKSLKSFYLLIFTAIILNSGCGSKGESSFSLPSLSGSDGSGDGVDGTSDGTGDPTQFYVAIKADPNVVAHVRKSTSFSTNCAISTSDSLSDITCYVDTPEGELFTNGLTFKYNVPANMCRYLRRAPYWYYNHEVGVGPTSIGMNITKNGSGDITSYLCSVDGGAAGSCSGHTEVSFNNSDNSATCVYDQSKYGGKNCCFGLYSKTITTTTPGGTTSDSSIKSWGGELGSCIGGPGSTDWENKSLGVPTPTLENAKYGLVGEYKIKAPMMSTFSSSNIPIANYYHPTAHSHRGLVSTRVTNLPYFLDPVDDRNGSLLPGSLGSTPNDNYTFECLDEAWKVKHRVRVYIREWDTYPDFLNYIASSGVTVNPDLGIIAIEPGGCTGIYGPCNDQLDMDDFLSVLGGSYDHSSATRKNLYYPKYQ